MAIKPITPQEATKNAQEAIPDKVILAFNQLITENLHGRQATVMQDAVVKRIKQLFKNEGSDITSTEIFDKHWLDVEPIFQKAGWVVSYDKPGYNEDYEASFCFKTKMKESGGYKD